jgi:hypothetical protein
MVLLLNEPDVFQELTNLPQLTALWLWTTVTQHDGQRAPAISLVLEWSKACSDREDTPIRGRRQIRPGP